MSSTHRASTHTHRGDQKHARAQSLLYLTFLRFSSLFTIFGSSKGVNPNLHLIMAFLGKISAHCDKPHFLPSRPKSPTPLQTPDPPKKARIGWRVMPARHKHRNINLLLLLFYFFLLQRFYFFFFPQHVMWLLMMMMHWQAWPLKPARSALEDARAKRAQSSSVSPPS